MVSQISYAHILTYRQTDRQTDPLLLSTNNPVLKVSYGLLATTDLLSLDVHLSANLLTGHVIKHQ